MFILLGGALFHALSLFLSRSGPRNFPFQRAPPTHQSRNLRGRRELPPARRTKRKENGNEKKGNVIWDPSARGEEQKKAK